jgi:hypothetical protein
MWRPQSIEAMAYEAFRSGNVTPQMQAQARQWIADRPEVQEALRRVYAKLPGPEYTPSPIRRNP